MPLIALIGSVSIGLRGAPQVAWATLIAGVPRTVTAMARSRGMAFAAHQARVSPFFPLPPRAASHPESA